MSAPEAARPGSRILVAEDSPPVRDQIVNWLTSAGYEVATATNGAEAIRKLHEDDSIEVALIDWHMPVLDGVAVCRQVRTMERFVSLIVVTSRAEDADMAYALENGADDFIRKPVNRVELDARVGAAVRICAIQSSLREAQQLETIGQLASGIAHEIKTPAQFVGDNIRFLEDSWPDLEPLLKTVFAMLDASPCDGESAVAAVERLMASAKEADIGFLLDEVPGAIRQARDGVESISRIVHAMKQLGHPGSEDRVATDLNALAESTAIVARNEWKYVADLDLDLDPSLPAVPCHPGPISQALLNLIVNAAHAIDDTRESRETHKGRIEVSTRVEGEWVRLQVEDDGTGIPESALPNIFDRFFTTKPSGKGTGQGLAIARETIESRHSGTISCENKAEGGARFVIRLPLAPDSSTEAM